MDAVIVSAAKETNGQNTRYVHAAKKHGGKVINAFAIGNSDPAGVVIRFQEAARNSKTLRIRSAARKDHSYLEFPHDLIWGKDDLEIVKLIMAADVIHLNNSYRAVERDIPRLIMAVDIANIRQSYRAAKHFRFRTPMLLHHHGSLFRGNPSHFLQVAEQRRWLSAVSTIDLLRFAPDILHWLPTVYDVAALEAYGKANRRPDDGRVLIAHAPTNRLFKGTHAFLGAVDELQAMGLPVDVDLIEEVTNAECMARKAKADIVFDQVTWGYGCNAVEAWAMGIPVVSGSDQWTDGKMREMWGDVPYALASESTLTSVLYDLVTSAQMRADYAAKGMAHVLRYHDEQPGLERLAELYAKAIRHYVGKAEAA